MARTSPTLQLDPLPALSNQHRPHRAPIDTRAAPRSAVSLQGRSLDRQALTSRHSWVSALPPVRALLRLYTDCVPLVTLDVCTGGPQSGPGPPRGLEESFVLLPQRTSNQALGAGRAPLGGSPPGQSQGAGDAAAAPAGLDAKLHALSQLFELASCSMQVDHPLCLDCASQLKDEIEAQVHTHIYIHVYTNTHTHTNTEMSAESRHSTVQYMLREGTQFASPDDHRAHTCTCSCVCV